MSKVLRVNLMMVLIALPMVVGQFAMGADEEAPTTPRTVRAGGKSQRRAILHTADSLDTILGRVSGKTAVLLDVREKHEWDAGHLRHAVFLPLSDLKEAAENPEVQELLSKLSKDRIVYCHCKGGGRVLTATPILKSLGYDVRPLKAGYDTLLEAGFEKATPEIESEE